MLAKRFDDLPVVGPETAQAVREYLEQATEPECATPRQIDGMLAKLAVVLPRKQRSDAESDQLMDVYHRALRGTPYVDLAYAFEKLTTTHRWFPTIEEILKHTAHPKHMRDFHRVKAREIIDRHGQWREPQEYITADKLGTLIGKAGAKLEPN